METLGYAENAEGANDEQFSKTLDSLESKLNELSNAWTEFTTGIADESAIKTVVEWLTKLVSALNDLTGVLGGGLLTSVARMGTIFGGLKLSGAAIGSVIEKNGKNSKFGTTTIAGLGEEGLNLKSLFDESIVGKLITGATATKSEEVMAASSQIQEITSLLQGGIIQDDDGADADYKTGLTELLSQVKEYKDKNKTDEGAEKDLAEKLKTFLTGDDASKFTSKENGTEVDEETDTFDTLSEKASKLKEVLEGLKSTDAQTVEGAKKLADQNLKSIPIFGQVYTVVSKLAGNNNLLSKTLNLSADSMGKIIGVSAGITALLVVAAGAIYYFATANKRAAESYEDLTEAIDTATSDIEELQTSLDTLTDGISYLTEATEDAEAAIDQLSFAEACKGVDKYGNNLTLTTEQFEALNAAAEQFVSIGLVGSTDEFYANAHEHGQQYIDDLKLQIQYKQQLAALEASEEWDKDASKGAINEYKEAVATAEENKTVTMGTKSVDSLKNIWDSLNLTDSDGNAFNAGDIFATDEWGINSYKTLTSDNLQMYEELKTKLSEWLSANAGDKNASKVSAAITEITAGIQQYNNQEGRQTGLDYQVDQAADGLIEEFQNEIRTQWEYYEDDPDIGVNPDWLMDYVANATRFKIDDTTTPAEIEKLKDDVVSLMNIDWAQYGKDPENNPWTTFQSSMTELEESKANGTITMKEYTQELFEILMKFWNNLPQEVKDMLAGSFGEFAGNYGFTGVDENTHVDDGGWVYMNDDATGYTGNTTTQPTVASSDIMKDQFNDWNRATGSDYTETQFENMVNGLSTEAAEYIQNGKIDLGELIDEEGVEISVDEAKAKIKELTAATKKAEKIEEDFGDTLSTAFDDMADAARDLHDDIDDIDFAALDEDGNGAIEGAEKFTEEYYNAAEAFDSFRESYGGVLDEFKDYTGIDLSTDSLIALQAEAQATGASLDQLALQKMDYNGIFLTGSTEALSADAVAAMSAAGCWGEAAAAQYAYEHKQPYKGMEDEQLAKYANTMATMATLKTVSYGGGGGSGGGGGGNNSQENDATYSQDPFYNYIKTVDQYTNALEELQRQQELLLDPTEIKNNLDAQELEYQRLIGANASYLAEVERQMAAFQQDAMNQYSQYISFAEDGSIRLSQEYFSLTGDAVETIDEWIDDYDDLLSKQTDLNEELDDYYAELKELWEDWRDNYIDIVNEIAEILQEQDEKMLEEKEDFYDKLEQQSEDYLDAVQKNIEKERDLRDKANNYEDLAKKQKRLALLQRDTSGRYDSEIQSLQEEIADAQQDMADEQVDDLLEQLQDQMDEDQRRHEETIELMEKQIDEYVETRAYILEAEEIVAQGDEAIIEHLMLGEEYLEASDAERQQMLDEWGPQIAGLGKYVENVQNGITTAQQYIASQINTELTRDTASVVQAVGSMASQLSGAMAQVAAAAASGSGGGGCGTSSSYATTCQSKCSGKCSTTNAMFGTSGSLGCSMCFGVCEGNCGVKNTIKYAYATGGIVDYTGPAWVDGTKSRPEAFLNPTQTSLIGSFAQNLERLSGTSNNLLSGIGDCNIEISIGSLGADYDIDQAIAKVKDEIVRSTEYRNINIFRRSR